MGSKKRLMPGNTVANWRKQRVVGVCEVVQRLSEADVRVNMAAISAHVRDSYDRQSSHEVPLSIYQLQALSR